MGHNQTIGKVMILPTSAKLHQKLHWNLGKCISSSLTKNLKVRRHVFFQP